MKGLLLLVLSLSTASFAAESMDVQTQVDRLNDLAGRDIGGYMQALDDLAANSPELSEAVLDQESETAAYETYREYKRDHADTYEEFLNWATPQEIAEDSVNSDGVSVAEEANSTLPYFLQAKVQDMDDATIQQVVATAGGLHIKVYRESQTMDAVGAGVNMHGHAIATGRKGHSTPPGCHIVDHTERLHYSKKYKAPMPLSVVFIPSVFIALHVGNIHVKSHGCVHVTSEDESIIYSTTNAIGASNVSVCVL